MEKIQLDFHQIILEELLVLLGKNHNIWILFWFFLISLAFILSF